MKIFEQDNMRNVDGSDQFDESKFGHEPISNLAHFVVAGFVNGVVEFCDDDDFFFFLVMKHKMVLNEIVEKN